MVCWCCRWHGLKFCEAFYRFLHICCIIDNDSVSKGDFRAQRWRGTHEGWTFSDGIELGGTGLTDLRYSGHHRFGHTLSFTCLTTPDLNPLDETVGQRFELENWLIEDRCASICTLILKFQIFSLQFLVEFKHLMSPIILLKLLGWDWFVTLKHNNCPDNLFDHVVKGF